MNAVELKKLLELKEELENLMIDIPRRNEFTTGIVIQYILKGMEEMIKNNNEVLVFES